MKHTLSINKLAVELGVPRTVLENVSKNKSRYYRPYTKLEKKRDGTVKERRIDNPNKSIRAIQKRINKRMLRPVCAELPEYMTGCIPGRSARDNARPHKASAAILSVDITNCFPSIKSSQVYEIFRDSFGCSPPVAKILTKLTTYGNRLPQGAPTSPSLCNLVLQPLVVELHQISSDLNLDFTQYVDDLTFSGTAEVLKKNQTLILNTVEKHGFEVNARKLKLTRRSQRMEVTGLVVNKIISVGRVYIRTVERDIMRGANEARVKGKISHIRAISKNKAENLRKKYNRTKIKQGLEKSGKSND